MVGGWVVCRLTGGVDVNGVADSDNTAELLRQTGLEESSLLYARWSGEVRRPACFVAVCATERWVVLGIRGTLNLNDCFTDVDAAEVALPAPVLAHALLCVFDVRCCPASSGSACLQSRLVRLALTQRRAGCAQVPFLGSVAHQGFVRSAENVVADTLPALRSAAANPELAGYELVVTGHSLGGCTAQTVALQLRDVGAPPSCQPALVCVPRPADFLTGCGRRCWQGSARRRRVSRGS